MKPMVNALSGAIVGVLLIAFSDSAAARFLSVDPVPAKSDDGTNFNRYWYAGNNPYTFTDPDGRRMVFIGNKKTTQELTALHNAVKASDPALRARLEYLENDDKFHQVKPTSDNHEPGVEGRTMTVVGDENTGVNGVPADTVTYMDPTVKLGPADSPQGTPAGVYAHEVGSHVYENATGTDDTKANETNPETGELRREERANEVERQYLRGKNGDG